MSYHVYILYSRTLDKFYVGYSRNVHQRLEQHNSGDSTFTSSGVPWILVWFCMKASKYEAEVLERKLKNLTRARKLRFMAKYPEGIILNDPQQ